VDGKSLVINPIYSIGFNQVFKILYPDISCTNTIFLLVFFFVCNSDFSKNNVKKEKKNKEKKNKVVLNKLTFKIFWHNS
jgi:hypothetical protein